MILVLLYGKKGDGVQYWLISIIRIIGIIGIIGIIRIF